jgi:hypothetical protein
MFNPSRSLAGATSIDRGAGSRMVNTGNTACRRGVAGRSCAHTIFTLGR